MVVSVYLSAAAGGSGATLDELLLLQKNTWQKACTHHLHTNTTGLRCSGPVLHHYIRTHTLSYHLTGASKEEAEKKEKREKVRTTEFTVHAAMYPLTRKNKKQHQRKGKPVSLVW